MGTSVGKTIDYLVDKLTNGFTGADATGQPVVVPALSTIDANVEVADGTAVTSDSPWVTIGTSGANQDSDVATTSNYLILGRQRIEESYTVPGDVIVYGDESEQKITRDKAVALFDGIVSAVWADPTLGGILQNGRIAHVSASTLSQPTPSSGSGSAAIISFTIAVENSYVP